jgi:hypothetical protein
MIMGVFLSLLNADAIDPEWLGGVTFNFDPDVKYVEYAFSEDHPMFLNKQIYDVGFETYNPVLNLGGLYIIMSFILAHMILLIIYKGLMSCLKVILHRLPSVKEGGNGEEPEKKKKKIKIKELLKNKKKTQSSRAKS